MKNSRLYRKMLSCVLATLMVFSACATAFAAIPGSPLSELKYVSLGDSMTNGYGLAGYNGNNGVLDYGDVSYANQFADWLVSAGYASSVDHKQLAMSGCRAEDYHWLLEFDHASPEMRAFVNSLSSGWSWNEEEWYGVFNIGDYRTYGDMCSDNNRCSAAASNILASGYDSPYATQGQKDAADCINHGTGSAGGYVHYTNDNQVAIVTEYLQKAIKEADIVSMSVGNSNFGTFMFDQIANAVGYSGSPEDAMKFKVDRALAECAPAFQEEVLKLLDELYAKIEEYLGVELDYAEATTPEGRMTAAVANAAVYAGISYILNYAGTVDAILKLNPDAEIIMVGLMNTYLTSNEGITEPTIGSLLDVIFPPLNAFIAALPTLMQGMNNEVYKDATFYYAEAPEVPCMVEVYGSDFYDENGDSNRGSITRQRFFRDLMGIIRGMMGDRDSFGAALNYDLTFEELCAYDDMDETEKAAYAYADSTDADPRSKAITCAIYLAFEKATIVAGREAPVTLKSVMELGDLGTAQFAGVFTSFQTNLEQNAPTFAPASFSAIAAIFNKAAQTDYHLVSEITPVQVATVYGIENADAKLAQAKAVAQTIADDPRNAAVIEAMANAGLNDGVYAYYYSLYAAQNSIPYTWEQFKQYGGANYTAFVNSVKAGAITTAKNTIIEESANILVSSCGYVSKLCQLLALPDSLGDAMAEDDKATSWFGLTSRCVIGDGLGGHPSAAGHNALFDAVKGSYETGYTAKDETLKNVKIIIDKYYDEAYAYAYAKADEKGYVDKAADAIDQAIKTIYTLDISNVEMTDEFRAKLEAELAAVVVTLNEVKTILKEDKASDVDGLSASISALWDDLNTHLTNAGALLDQAEFDIKTLVVPVVDAYVRAQVESLKETIKTEAIKAGHKPYKKDADSYYVAIGGDTVKGVGIGRDENGYYDLIGAHYDISKKTVSQSKLLPSGVLGLIVANQAEIKQADLITLQLDASSILYATLTDTPNWDKYLDAEEKALIDEIFTQTEEILTTNWAEYADAKLEEIIPKIKVAVLAKLPEEIPFADYIFDVVAEIAVSYLKNVIADVEAEKDAYVSDITSKIESLDEMVKDYAEKLAYAVVSYAAESKVAVKAIQTINPDAALVVAGMYNPAKGLVIKTADGEIDAGALFASAVDAANLYYTANAIENGNVAFVDISDAETNGFTTPIDATVLELDQITTLLLNAADSMHANAKGHTYISQQIIKALTCVPGAFEAIDADTHAIKCAICEEVIETKDHTFTDNKCDDCGYTKVVVPDEDDDKTSGGGGGGGAATNQFTIKFVTNGGSAVKNVSVKKDGLLTAPTAPTKAGYVFGGWYTDKALTERYDFATPVTKAFTLYAKWTKAEAKFGDIDLNAWYFEYVKEAMEKGLMNGISDTEFAPNATLTRGMFVTVLHRIEKEAKAENGVEFTDVSKDAYYANAVKWANANGIVMGISETEFAPDAEVTREQMAAIIARYAEYKNIKVAEKDDAAYTDEDQIAEYAKDAVQIANKLGVLIGNVDGSFAPKKNATRAEAATLFVRLLGLLK